MNDFRRRPPDRQMTGHDPNDTALWLRARDGDPEAFGSLFDRYADLVYRYSYVRLQRADAAEEVVSIVFSEAWRQRDRIELLSKSLRPWLLGVARNQCNRHHSKRLRDISLARQLATVDEPDHSDLIDRRADAGTELESILAAIDSLPEGQQEVLALKVWGELSHEEVAAQLGVSVGTVKSRLNRARARLNEIRGTRTVVATSRSGASQLHEANIEGEENA